MKTFELRYKLAKGAGPFFRDVWATSQAEAIAFAVTFGDVFDVYAQEVPTIECDPPNRGDYLCAETEEA